MRERGRRIGTLGSLLAVVLAAPAAAASPTFTGPTPFAAGTSPTAMTSADLNADGRPDLATADQADGVVDVLMNATTAGAGTPSFTGPTPYGSFVTRCRSRPSTSTATHGPTSSRPTSP